MLHDPFNDHAADIANGVGDETTDLVIDAFSGLGEGNDIAVPDVVGCADDLVNEPQALRRGCVINTPSMLGSFKIHFLTPSNTKRRKLRSSS